MEYQNVRPLVDRESAISELHFPQILRRLFGRRGVDIEARAPLEPLDAGKARHDLQVPMAAAQHTVRLGLLSFRRSKSYLKILHCNNFLAANRGAVCLPG